MKYGYRILAACAAMAATPAHAVTYTGAGGAIADLSTIDSTITGVAPLIITDVNVTITNLVHTYWADLDIYLIKGSTTIQLTTDNGGGSDPNGTFTFDDSATWTATADLATQVSGGTFRPEQALTAFNGLNASGSWLLRIVDDAGADVGSYANWQLTITGTAVPVPEPGSWATMLTGFALMGAALRRPRRLAVRLSL